MPKGHDDGPDMEYLGEMNADFARLAAAGGFDFRGEAMEELERQIKLYCKPGNNNRLVFRPGMDEDGNQTTWFYFQDLDTGEIFEGANNATHCPPLPIEECA